MRHLHERVVKMLQIIDQDQYEALDVESEIAFAHHLESLEQQMGALACYHRILTVYPDQPDALEGKCKLLYTLGRFDDCAQTCDYTLGIYPYRPAALSTMVLVLSKMPNGTGWHGKLMDHHFRRLGISE